VLIETEGPATFEEWEGAIAKIPLDPSWRRGMNVVHDMRKATHVPDAIEGRKRISILFRTKDLGVKRWAVVVERPAQYGMGRMAEAEAEILGGLVAFRVLRDFGEALAWAAEE